MRDIQVLNLSAEDSNTKEIGPDYINFSVFDDLVERVIKENSIKKIEHAKAYMTANSNKTLQQLIRGHGGAFWYDRATSNWQYNYAYDPRVTVHRTQFGDIEFIEDETMNHLGECIGALPDTDCVYFVVPGKKGKEPIVYVIKNIKRLSE